MKKSCWKMTAKQTDFKYNFLTICSSHKVISYGFRRLKIRHTSQTTFKRFYFSLFGPKFDSCGHKLREVSSKHLCLCSTEERWLGLGLRVSRWWQNVHFWTNCSFHPLPLACDISSFYLTNRRVIISHWSLRALASAVNTHALLQTWQIHLSPLHILHATFLMSPE